MSRPYSDAAHARRREVLRETLNAVERRGDALRARAQQNLARWKAAAASNPAPHPTVQVVAGDWGTVTQALTRQHGALFAVLNMANAFHPGGAYLQGAVAQEENMFRRTDCHFSLRESGHYSAEMTALLSAQGGRVYLDSAAPRTALRGAEDRSREDLGYPWLEDDQLFPFIELRAAAVDLRGGLPFDEAEMRRRIAAQLDTLVAQQVRHAVLGAFGCGAFHNPAPEVARLYFEELTPRVGSFELVAFAIFHAGYGPDNYAAFAQVFKQA